MTAHQVTGASPADSPATRIAQLEGELSALRERLEAAEWALRHLGGEGPPEPRIARLLEEASREAQKIREEARVQVERVVAEAEQLRSFARHGAQQAAGQARGEVALKAQALLDDATRLRASAQKEAAQIRRAALAERDLIQAQMEEISHTAREIYADAARRREEVDTLIAQAREQADLILRQARLAAENRARELTEAAQRRLKTAQEDAQKMVDLASQTARRRRAELEELERQARLRLKELEERHAALSHQPPAPPPPPHA